MTDPSADDLLGRALDALERVQQQLEHERAASREPVAVVGLGCRFPGADDANAFAAFLDAGGDSVREIPGARAQAFAGCHDASLRRGGFFDDLAAFDARPCGVSDEEARAMDPQQHLLLQVTWQALADAGAAGAALAGTRTGVYLGLGAQNFDFGRSLLDDERHVDRHAIAGTFHSLMPGRISYLLDLRGPSLVVDAACASGLVAVHLACQSLRRHECDAAIAAAVNLVESPRVSLAVQRSGLWSAAGHCRSFDAAADGFVRGEGCGVLLLKRLSDALASGDAIRAVIHGSAVGQDGRSNGLTAPNGPAQEAVIRRALEDAGVDAARVGYVEAHATGTLLGDAIEVEALGAVYGGQRPSPLLVGALKPNLGHLEAAAGMAGLVKAILCVERRAVPPTLHHERLNPDIALASPAITVVTGATTLPAQAPYAGASAFGMSGTNAHVIVGPAPGDGSGSDLLAELQWHAGDASAAAASAPRGKVVLGGDASLASRVDAGLAAAGFEPVPVAAAMPDLPEAGDWHAVLDAHPGADVVHLCGPETEGVDPGAHRARVLGGLLALGQALAQAEGPPRRVFVATLGASQGAVHAAMALSLGRSLALEHADLRLRCVDLDDDLPDPGTALAAEIAATEGEPWVRRTVAGACMPRVVPMRLPVRAFRARPSACYLVSGGFGGIGRMLADWLVDRGARDLMLLGRHIRDLPEEARWRERGVKLRRVAADVADPVAVAGALAQLSGDAVPLAGVFHAAGVQDDALLYRQDWPRFAQVLRAKVDGARVLREATRGQPLDAFVLFSSVSVVCGLVGAGAYVAANAALGALARRWRDEGVPALCVLWGTWEGSGMAAASTQALGAHWQELGIRPFAPALGTDALESLLAADRTEAIAASIDWERLARWAQNEATGARLYEHCLPASPAAASSPVADPAEGAPVSAQALPALVREVVAKVLGLPPDDPALAQPFGELGLGSLAAIELRTQLSARLGIPVPATLAFNHPSVEAVVKFLGKRLREAQARGARA